VSDAIETYVDDPPTQFTTNTATKLNRHPRVRRETTSGTRVSPAGHYLLRGVFHLRGTTSGGAGRVSPAAASKYSFYDVACTTLKRVRLNSYEATAPPEA